MSQSISKFFACHDTLNAVVNRHKPSATPSSCREPSKKSAANSQITTIGNFLRKTGSNGQVRCISGIHLNLVDFRGRISRWPVERLQLGPCSELCPLSPNWMISGFAELPAASSRALL